MSKKSVFGFKKAEDSSGYLLWKTTVTWQRLIKKALDPFDISHAQFVILAVTKWISQSTQEATQVNISTLSGLDKMTVSKSLKKLIALKLVRRSEHMYDTRAKVVELTPKGDKLISKLVPLVEEVDRNFFGNLVGRDQKSLIKIFNKLAKL